jgi:hypothetical protein
VGVAVIYAGKDCENRGERASRVFQSAVGRRIYVHASKAFPTKAELAYAIKYLRNRGIECPDPSELAYGGVIGSVFVTGIVIPTGAGGSMGRLLLFSKTHGHHDSARRRGSWGCSA